MGWGRRSGWEEEEEAGAHSADAWSVLRDWGREQICHNTFLGVVMQSLCEVTVLAERSGMPRHVFLEALNASVMGSVFTRWARTGAAEQAGRRSGRASS